MSRNTQRVAPGSSSCDCGETSALLTELLMEQGKMITGLKDEVEALRATCDRAVIELMWRIETARGSTPGAETPAAQSQTTVAEAAENQTVASVPKTAVRLMEKQPVMSGAEYSRLVTRIRSLARTVLPVNAVVAVVSRGDEALVELEGRIAWHFPRLEDGRWVGHHPADDDEAVAHLELARRRGARFLLIPSTALWWLDHYSNFREHLDATSAPVLRRDDACRIFALNPPGAA